MQEGAGAVYAAVCTSLKRKEVVAYGIMRKEGFAGRHLLDDCAHNIPAERTKSNVAVPTLPK
jgi:hypothetical protein